MFTLLIADDEPLAQVGLKSMLDWEALGISLVGSSPNGAHALEAIKRLQPDIVIADVRMPIIDGITLIERCRAEMDTPPEFIVLSGHADFDYARRAIRSGVVDYLVKLELDEGLLRESVEKAMTAVRAKRTLSLSFHSAPPGDSADTTTQVEAAAGLFSEEGFAHFLTEGGIRAGGEARLVPAVVSATFGVDCFHCAVSIAVAYQHGDRLSREEKERTYRCVVDTVRQVAGREATVHVAPFDIGNFAVVLSFETEDLDPEGAEIAAGSVVERAREPAERYFAVDLRAGIGSAVRELSLLPESYRAATNALALTHTGRTVVRSGAQRSLRSMTDSPELERAKAEFVQAVETRSVDLLRSAVDATIAELAREPASAGETLAICCDLLYALLGRLDGAAAMLDSFFPDEAEGYRWLFSAGEAGRMRCWLQAVRDGVASRFESKLARARNPLVAGVREYVLARWGEKVTLPDVAAHFHVSPNHLSSIFKKYNGTGFIEFVGEVKMEKAKELITAGRYKMYEIAQLLAYEDAYYFSKVFKKATGMSPREYHLRHAIVGGDASSEAVQDDSLNQDKKRPIS